MTESWQDNERRRKEQWADSLTGILLRLPFPKLTVQNHGPWFSENADSRNIFKCLDRICNLQEINATDFGKGWTPGRTWELNVRQPCLRLGPTISWLLYLGKFFGSDSISYSANSKAGLDKWLVIVFFHQAQLYTVLDATTCKSTGRGFFSTEVKGGAGVPGWGPGTHLPLLLAPGGSTGRLQRKEFKTKRNRKLWFSVVFKSV